MPSFGQDDLELDGPAFIEFGADGAGTFQFVCVFGQLDASFSVKLGKPHVNFAWVGHDERVDVHGQGTGTVQANGSLTGKISFYLGDTHAFTARKEEAPASRRQARESWPRRPRPK